MDTTYKARGLRNSGEAYRQFRQAGFLAGAYAFAMDLLGHRFAGAVIAFMGVVGLAGVLVTFLS